MGAAGCRHRAPAETGRQNPADDGVAAPGVAQKPWNLVKSARCVIRLLPLIAGILTSQTLKTNVDWLYSCSLLRIFFYQKNYLPN
jgi:hypothetical protein